MSYESLQLSKCGPYSVVVDTETYYDSSLSVSELGVQNYVQHPDVTLEIVTWVKVFPDGTLSPVETLWRNTYAESQWREELARKLGPVLCGAHTIWAANVNFDRAVLERWVDGVAELGDERWECVQDLAAYNQFPRALAELYPQVFPGRELSKAVRNWARARRANQVSAEDLEKWLDYARKDTQAAAEVLVELLRKYPRPSPIEHILMAQTRRLNRRGVAVDLAELRAQQDVIHILIATARQRIPWAESDPALSYIQLVQWCARQNIPAPPRATLEDDVTYALCLKYPALKDVLEWMRTLRKANTLLRKARSVEMRTYDTGDGEMIMPLELIYAGAPHTKRWSCRGVNIQNLDREPWDVDTGGGTIQRVWPRKWFRARKGRVLYIVDFAQIEPRVLHYLSGNKLLLDAMRQGFSYYEAYATMTGRWSGAPGTMKKTLGADEYVKIKSEALGLGYGMGPDKFAAISGYSVTEAERAVARFRRTFPNILAFWRRLETSFGEAVRSGKTEFVLELPNGERLIYPDIWYNATQGSFFAAVSRGDKARALRIWGGTMTENIVQRVARDVMGEVLARFETAHKDWVLFHAHDEIVLEVPTDLPEDQVRNEIRRLFTTPPAWARGLPLDIDINVQVNYTK